MTCRGATTLQSAVIGTRIAALRTLTVDSHRHLTALIDRLPKCTARVEIAHVIESSMSTFRAVCSCNEDFLRLSRAVAMRGLTAPFASPVDAARLARSCCQTCDDVTRALRAVSSWLSELAELVGRGAAGRRALMQTSDQQHLSVVDESETDGDDEAASEEGSTNEGDVSEVDIEEVAY